MIKKLVLIINSAIVIPLLFLLVLTCSCSKGRDRGRISGGFIVTSPEIAEILSEVDGTVNITGITAECNYPAELLDKKVVGTFSRVDMEKILELDPDVVFTSGLEQEKLSEDLLKIGLNVVRIYPRSIADLLSAVTRIGIITGNEPGADKLRRSLELIIETVRDKTEPGNRPSVYVEIYGSPIMSVSDDSYVGELIELAGGRNIFSNLGREYSRISQEDVINADPQVIILAYPGISREDIIERKGWGDISACRQGRIYDANEIDPDLILRATPRSIRSIPALKEIIHGD